MSLSPAAAVAPGSLLLQTSKLRLPTRTRSVERPRLGALLERSPDVRLVLVSAPPGFGKTTLLADWVESSGVRCAWLTLDDADNDCVRFARYLVAAIGRLSGNTEDLRSLEIGRPFDPEATLAAILARLEAASAGRDRNVAVVLDDYHRVHEPTIHRLVASLVERLPPAARLVIGTRADPPLPIARLRARGELLELRGDDLRFTTSEAAELFRSSAVDLADADVADVTSRTEGWAAVLRLAAVSLQGRADQAEVVRRFGASHRYVLDYVLDEVLAGLAPETQDFLLRTSILDRLSGQLCDAVTERSDGQARLEELERANLLTVPLDEERRWYRYHALFGEILRARLASVEPDEVAALHGRASSWHEEHGDDEEAIAHALASGDAERGAGIVANSARRHINAGEIRTVRRWLDALPREVVAKHAELAAAYAWCQILAGEIAGVAERLAEADRALAAAVDSRQLLVDIPAQLAMLRSQLAGMTGDTERAVTQARLACDLVPPDLPPLVKANLRGSASSLLGLALARAGQLDAAARAYEAALPHLRATDNQLALGRTVADLAGIEIRRGDPARALALCEKELRLAATPEDAHATGARTRAIWSALARAHVDLGQLDAAEACARQAVELATRAGEAGVARSAEATLARIAAQRDATFAGRRLPRRDGLVESLSARELEVLRLVALGRSNTQIAAELFVTVGTVKAHVHAICGKLAAANRVQAIVRARELRILD